ncbi:inosine-5-monophosphate dehydrogenase [Naegleria gruberi]|uniref:GMP reductase n=1 Tax=Naegleria gruberi TaxID=5762 RepID=D2UY23_NAEGR|nr:inosine-5-monophosphate dehydrogenase [Naegleria gruberi]EFC50722.1 inosine-5-monophosphate dehydrogenase [Naegleria gruberi]|eukprot:XP_002683466.1 inosine-5-monophosphate dehydrogenase [Naegleria gruberi strain NEG-M]
MMSNIHQEVCLTFDDVTLVPQYNNVPSRLHPSLDTWLTKNTKIGMPLLAANMDTVIGDELADVLIANGGIPLFHRFTSFEKQSEWVKKYENNCFVSCGLNDMESTVKLLELGAKGVVIDIAHGHSDAMCTFIRNLKKQLPHKEIIAGNVCTPMGYQDLVTAGADAVKVGVGCGAACTTRIKTGFGLPQFSAIKNCAELARKLRVPIIADGGIVFERDMVLALAAGASTVMMGSIFAKTMESAAPKSKKTLENGQEITLVKYRGQASKDFQDDFYGGLKKGTVPEGVSFHAKCTGSAQDVIDNFCGSLRSALTYGGAKDIKELQRKAEFVRVTPNFGKESHPRPEQL